ncbi:hypothetical protein BDW69DRAFT_197478 [Aspergillus filifer]
MRFSLVPDLSATALVVDPAAVYNGSSSSVSDVKLRIGNGSAGQSGFVKALADKFIQSSVANGSDPFLIAWYTSDTSESINYLKEDTHIAINQGIAKSPAWYAFRDHFLLVGPTANPAGLRKSDDIRTMFSDIFSFAKADLAGETSFSVPTRFLTRYDKSATNIKESTMWTDIGQVPWAPAYSKWYHQYADYPVQALTAEILLQEYNITDRGTYLSIDRGGDGDAEDPLLNPAHILVGAKASNRKMTERFVEWVVSEEGQGATTGFMKNGQQLYSATPEDKTAQL